MHDILVGQVAVREDDLVDLPLVDEVDDLGFVMDRIRDRVGEILLIGIEPEEVSFGEGLSPVVECAATSLIDSLKRDALNELHPL